MATVKRKDEVGCRAGGDRDQRPQARTGRDAQDAWLSQWIAEDALHDGAGDGQAPAGQDGRRNTRQPDQQDHRAVGRINES